MEHRMEQQLEHFSEAFLKLLNLAVTRRPTYIHTQAIHPSSVKDTRVQK